MLHQRTEGNPLFMVKVVEDWLAQGLIAEVEGRWELQREIEELARRAPQSLRQLIEQQLERLSPEEQQVLEAASVAGAEFSAAAVAAGIEAEQRKVEERCEGLGAAGPFAASQRDGGVAGWDGGGALWVSACACIKKCCTSG